MFIYKSFSFSVLFCFSIISIIFFFSFCCVLEGFHDEKYAHFRCFSYTHIQFNLHMYEYFVCAYLWCTLDITISYLYSRSSHKLSHFRNMCCFSIFAVLFMLSGWSVYSDFMFGFMYVWALFLGDFSYFFSRFVWILYFGFRLVVCWLWTACDYFF